MTALQDNTLLTTVEELFTHTENVVISAIQVVYPSRHLESLQQQQAPTTWPSPGGETGA
jgi:hypothetical protein